MKLKLNDDKEDKGIQRQEKKLKRVVEKKEIRKKAKRNFLNGKRKAW